MILRFALLTLLFGFMRTAHPQEPPGWKLVWADEFDVNGPPNPARWDFERGFVRNNELQWYQPGNAECTNGLLVIEARREKRPNPNHAPGGSEWRRQREHIEYTSSSLVTRGKFSWQYGLLEVRAKIETHSGMWPAIWTLGISGRWPANGEVDVMEFYRRNGVASILANTAWSRGNRARANWDNGILPLTHFTERDPEWASKFHVWRMEWNENEIKLSLDGEVLNTTDISATVNDAGFNPFRQPHYLLLNLAIGSNGGDPSATSFPRRYEIDYVRIYRHG